MNWNCSALVSQLLSSHCGALSLRLGRRCTGEPKYKQSTPLAIPVFWTGHPKMTTDISAMNTALELLKTTLVVERGALALAPPQPYQHFPRSLCEQHSKLRKPSSALHTAGQDLTRLPLTSLDGRPDTPQSIELLQRRAQSSVHIQAARRL